MMNFYSHALFAALANGTTPTASLLCDSKVLASIGNQTLYPYETYSNLTHSNQYICPDHYSNSTFSVLFVFFETILLAFTCLLMFCKRKHQHVTQRNIPVQIAHLGTSYFFSFLTSVRYVIGRHTYPCALHLFLYFELPPLVLLNKILKCWRIYARHMIEKDKSRFYRKSAESVNSVSDMSSSVGENVAELDSEMTSSTSISALNHEKEINHENIHQIPKIIQTRIQFFKFSIHPLFHLSIYGILFIIHLVLFFIISGIDIGINQRNSSYFLTTGVSPLDFTRGCITNANISYIAGALSFIYVVVELITLVLCFLSLKDTYFQKVETILLVIFQLLTIVIFVTLSAVPAYKNMAEFFFSYAYIPVIYLIFDVFVGTTLPCFYAIYEDYQNGRFEVVSSELELNNMNNITKNGNLVEKSILEHVLENKTWFEKLLDYAKRSYCSESVLCFKDVAHYRKLSGKKTADNQRLKFAQYLMNSYLLPNSPALLNMPTVYTQKVEEWKESLFSNQSIVIGNDFFDEIRQHCLNDMTDVFNRFKTSNKELEKFIENIKK